MPREVAAEPLPLRQIRFFYDWGHQWPLWENGATHYAAEPQHLGLSDELAKEMLSLYRFWSTNMEPETGWARPNQQAEFLIWAAQVALKLQREISSWGVVLFEIHPHSIIN